MTVQRSHRALSPETDDYLTRRQIAELLHVSELTLLRWASAGEGPPYIRMGKRHVRYMRVDFDAWVAARRFVHADDEAARAG